MADCLPTKQSGLPVLHGSHGRRWRENVYVYPVVSRRSGGLSIGINLNPDKACNFDCIYCQVDRQTPPVVRDVDLRVLEQELRGMLHAATQGSLFEGPPFDAAPPRLRAVRDIAFSGDGEPTTSPVFAESVELAAALRSEFGLTEAKLVLITDACYLTRPAVARGLEIMDRNHGEIWAKLDAGTEDYYRLVNRPNVPLATVLDNILVASRVRPIVIQSLWMRVRGEPPGTAEITAFVSRLRAILSSGGQIKLVQVYTVARRPAERYVTALPPDELKAIADRVLGETGLPAQVYGGYEPPE